jgi:integrase/recombinase XerC
MGRPRKEFPEPHRRRRGDRWHIYWWADGSTYSVSVGAVSEEVAEQRRLELALALRTGKWPEWAAEAPAVQRYRETTHPPGELLDAYARRLQAEVSSGWARTSLGHLRELVAVTGKELSAVQPRDAQAFLEHVVTTPGPHATGRGVRSPATRNRALAACSRFYRWAQTTGRLTRNPFGDISGLPEPEAEEITYLTRAERDRLLLAADEEPDGMAVWLACYAGLRRSEVARAEWSHVRRDRGRLYVPPGKTGRSRIVPLAEALAGRLAEGGQGQIVPWPEAPAQWQWRARRLLRTLQPAVSDGPRLGWNVLRHTFGSLLAQAGVSLDKVAAWMGHSAAICRRHYAQFVPRDRRDEDIDRL